MSADALHQNADSREAFAAHLLLHHEVTIDAGFRPRRVVLAIKWKDGWPLTVIESVNDTRNGQLDRRDTAGKDRRRRHLPRCRA